MTLDFHPLVPTIIRSFIPMPTSRKFVITDRLQEELRRPMQPGDPTALVSEYKLDWWNVGPDMPKKDFHLGDFEEAYMFHALNV